MSGVLALAVGIVLVGLHGHRPLLWSARRGISPAVLLTGWVLSAVGLVAASVSMTVLLVLPADDHRAGGFLELAGGCWTALSAGALPGWREAASGVGLLTSAVVLGRVGWAVLGLRRVHRQKAGHLESLRRLAAQVPGGQPLEVRDDRPLAVSVGGRPGIIVISDGLRACLSPSALSATLAHEQAHVDGRHHALVAVIETLGHALPVVPLLRVAPGAVRDLVELAADRVAARSCGAAAVHEALTRVSHRPGVRPGPPRGLSAGLHGVAMGLHMAQRLTDVRLQRLAGGTGSPLLTRFAACSVVVVGSTLLPVATGWFVANSIGCAIG